MSGTQGFRAADDEITFLLDCRKWTKFIKVGNSRCCQTGFSIFSLDSAKLLGSSCRWCSLHKNAPCTYIGLCLKNSACSHTFVLLFYWFFQYHLFWRGKKSIFTSLCLQNCLRIQVMKDDTEPHYVPHAFPSHILSTRKMVLTLW